MSDAPAQRTRSFFRQARALLALGWRQRRNMFVRSRVQAPGLRAATAGKSDRKLVLPVLFGILMLGFTFMMCHQAVHGLAGHADQRWPAAEGNTIMELSFLEFWTLEFHVGERANEPAGSGSEDWEPQRARAVAGMSDLVRDQRGLDEAAASEVAKEILSHYDRFGINGFAKREDRAFARWIDLGSLSPEASQWFGRVMGFVVFCLLVGVALLPLSSRTKDLGSLDVHLEWLYCLPLTGREILSGRFLSMTLVRPLVWVVLLPLCSTLFFGMGLGWLGLAAALAVTLAMSVSVTGFELAVETWLRSSAGYGVQKNVQAAATVLGTLGIFLGMGAGLAAERATDWLDWILGHTPAWFTGGAAYLIGLPQTGAGGVWQLLGGLLVMSMVFGVGGWLVAARALRGGLISGGGRQGIRSRSAARVHAGGLVKFEWLLLRRDRNLAILVLVMPLMLLGYQLLINPGLMGAGNARNLAVIGFGCGVWAATMTAPHVVASEARSMWIVFSLPTEIANYFRRRMQVWRLSGVLMTIGVLSLLVAWSGGVPGEDWWRLPAAVMGVWVMGFVVYSIIMGGTQLPDLARGERLKVGVMRTYLCMILAGAAGSVLWNGTAWQVFAGFVIWWFLGISVWQGMARRLRYLLEPTNEALPKLMLSHAMVAVLVFFGVQMLFGAGGLGLVSFVAAGLVTSAYCAVSLSRHSLPKPSGVSTKPGADLVRVLLLCVASGLVWMAVVRNVPPIRELFDQAQAESAGVLDLHSWVVIVLVVVVAPLVEEFLFRGYVLRIMLTTWSPRVAVFASALLFAVVHPALSFPPVLVLGLGAAWLYTRSGRLWPCIILHAVYNGAIVLISWQTGS